jgi:hypothetical protein
MHKSNAEKIVQITLRPRLSVHPSSALLSKTTSPQVWACNALFPVALIDLVRSRRVILEIQIGRHLG